MNQDPQLPPPQQHLSPERSAPPPPYFYHAHYPHLLAPDPRHAAPTARAAITTTIGSPSRSLSQPQPAMSPDQPGGDASGDDVTNNNNNVNVDGEGDDEEPIYFIPLHATASHAATERSAAGQGSMLYHHQQQQQEPTHQHPYGLHPHQFSLQYPHSYPFYSYPPPPPPSPYYLFNHHHHHHHHNQRPYAPMAHPHSSHYPSTLTGLSHHPHHPLPPPAVMMMHPAPPDTVPRPMYSVRGGEPLLQQEQQPQPALSHPQPQLQSSTLYSQRQDPASSSLPRQEQLEPEIDEERDVQIDDGGASPLASSNRQDGLHCSSSSNKNTGVNRTGPEDADSSTSQSGVGARSGDEGGEDTGSSQYQGGDPLLTATLHEPIIELPQYIPIAITGGSAGAGRGEYVIFTTDPFYLDQNTGASHLFQQQRVYRHQPSLPSSSNSSAQLPLQYHQIQFHPHRLPGVASLSASASASQAPSANASVAGGGGSAAGDRSISPLPLAALAQPSSSVQALQLQQLQLRWEQGERQRQQLLLQQQTLAREAEQAAAEDNAEQKESDDNDDGDVVSANAVASTHDLEMDQARDEESLSNEPQEDNDETDSDNDNDDQYQLPVDATHPETVRISSTILQQQLPEGFHPSYVYTHQQPEPHLITPQYDPPCSVAGATAASRLSAVAAGTQMLSTSVPQQLPSSSKATGSCLAVANRELNSEEAGGGAVFKSDKFMKNGTETGKSVDAIAATATAKMRDSLKKKRSRVLPTALNGTGAASLKKKKVAPIIPSDRDVLCGKGGRTLMHNRHFTSLCNKFCDEYSNTTKRGMNGKRGIALQIIGEIHEQKGRFLAPASEVEGAGAGDAWVEISTEKAINKVAHCIRDLVRRLRASSPA